jgi:hypothetical protein
MLNSLLFSALVVVGIWILIMAIFLIVSRRQPDVAAQIEAIEDKLNREETEVRE